MAEREAAIVKLKEMERAMAKDSSFWKRREAEREAAIVKLKEMERAMAEREAAIVKLKEMEARTEAMRKRAIVKLKKMEGRMEALREGHASATERGKLESEAALRKMASDRLAEEMALNSLLHEAT